MSSSQNLLCSDPPVTHASLAPLHDVVCHVDVMLGTATMSVRECIHLRKGSLLKLTRSAGADMQLLVNGIAVASGEVVVIDDGTAIRITEVLAPPSGELAS